MADTLNPGLAPDDGLDINCHLEPLARVLEGLHGTRAAGIAEFLSLYHNEEGNSERSQAWTRVAQRVRDREAERIFDRLPATRRALEEGDC